MAIQPTAHIMAGPGHSGCMHPLEITLKFIKLRDEFLQTTEIWFTSQINYITSAFSVNVNRCWSPSMKWLLKTVKIESEKSTSLVENTTIHMLSSPAKSDSCLYTSILLAFCTNKLHAELPWFCMLLNRPIIK